MHSIYDLVKEVYWWEQNYKITYVNSVNTSARYLLKIAMYQVARMMHRYLMTLFVGYYLIKMWVWTNDFIQFY